MAGKGKSTRSPYDAVKLDIMGALEELPLVKGPTIPEYIAALQEIRREVDDWFEASLDASQEDLKRQR